MMVSSVRFTPRNAPAISIIFTSPKPIPSRPRSRKYASETSHSRPLPTAAPNRASANESTGDGGGNSKRMRGKPLRRSIRRLREKAQDKRQSQTCVVHHIGQEPFAKIGENQHHKNGEKTAHLSASTVSPNANSMPRKSNPVSASTTGYIGEIRALHPRHFPPSTR